MIPKDPTPAALEKARELLGERPHPPGCPDDCLLHRRQVRTALALDEFAAQAVKEDRAWQAEFARASRG